MLSLPMIGPLPRPVRGDSPPPGAPTHQPACPGMCQIPETPPPNAPPALVSRPYAAHPWHAALRCWLAAALRRLLPVRRRTGAACCHLCPARLVSLWAECFLCILHHQSCLAPDLYGRFCLSLHRPIAIRYLPAHLSAAHAPKTHLPLPGPSPSVFRPSSQCNQTWNTLS